MKNVALLLFLWASTCRAEAAELFSPPAPIAAPSAAPSGGGTGSPAPTPEPSVVQVRAATFDLSRLRGQGRVTLNLFGDAIAEAVQDSVQDRGSEGFTWFGTVPGDPLSSVILTVRGDRLAGRVLFNGRAFSAVPTGPGQLRLEEIDLAKVPPDRSIPAEGIRVKDSEPAPSDFRVLDDGSDIEVLVAFTQDVQTAAGGLANTLTSIQQGIDQMNRALSNSQVSFRVSLASAVLASYTETSNAGTDLSAITETSDGTLDSIHDLRETFRADLVSFWVKSMTSFSGLAWCINSDSVSSAFGFSVVDYDFAAGASGVFSHELGHNLGAAHDRNNVDCSGFHSYSHGYQAASGNFRTMMAYANNCPGGGVCTLYEGFSNPDVSNGGEATGVAIGQSGEAHVASTFNSRASAVANFRRRNASVSISRRGEGGGRVVSEEAGLNCGGGGSCSAVVAATMTVTLKAFPTAGSVLENYEGSADCSDGVLTDLESSDAHCTAVFRLSQDPAFGFPSPYDPKRGHTTMTFDKTIAGSTIRIYSLAGDVIAELTSDVLGQATWNVRDRFGAKIPPGTYLVRVQKDALNKTFRILILD